jgi:hypothetical protein
VTLESLPTVEEMPGSLQPDFPRRLDITHVVEERHGIVQDRLVGQIGPDQCNLPFSIRSFQANACTQCGD